MSSLITIRRYTEADIPEMQQLLHTFVSENRGDENYENHFKGIDINDKGVYEKLTRNVDNVLFFFDIVSVDAKIVGGLCAEVGSPFYTSDKIAYDHILYLLPEFSNRQIITRLIQNYVAWAERRKVRECRLCSSTGYHQNAFTLLCKRYGFKQFEVGFVRSF